MSVLGLLLAAVTPRVTGAVQKRNRRGAELDAGAGRARHPVRVPEETEAGDVGGRAGAGLNGSA